MDRIIMKVSETDGGVGCKSGDTSPSANEALIGYPTMKEVMRHNRVRVFMYNLYRQSRKASDCALTLPVPCAAPAYGENRVTRAVG